MPSNNMGSEESREQWFYAMAPFIPFVPDGAERWISGELLDAVAGTSEHRRSAGINWGRTYCVSHGNWLLESGKKGYRFVPKPAPPPPREVAPLQTRAAPGSLTDLRQTEQSFLGQVVAYSRVMGWRVYHTHDSRRSAPGFPDLVLVRRPRCVFAELKAERTHTTEDQRTWLAELRECGQEAYLWRPSHWRAIEKILR
jgi:hypothetical protein